MINTLITTASSFPQHLMDPLDVQASEIEEKWKILDKLNKNIY